MPYQLTLDPARLDAFCRRWKIARLELFGSALRDDFRPDSDLDILVSFTPQAEWTLLDHVAVSDELSEMLGRRVDLLTRRAVERSQNPLRRQAILGSAIPLHVPD
jgi:predicted nucleotidyltransferase